MCRRQAAAFLRAAQRAFMSWESLFRPAAVIPVFFLLVVIRPVFLPAFCLAQRALAAAANFARVAPDILRLPVWAVERCEALPRTEARRRSRVSICRRIETASSSDLRDM